MFTVLRRFFAKNKVCEEVTDKEFVRQQIEKIGEKKHTRVYVSGWLSKELKKELKAKGYRILEFEYISLKYTLIAR